MKKTLMIPLRSHGWSRGRKGVLWSLAIGATLFVSCQKGFDSDEVFQSKVTNSQLESPEQTDISFSRVFNADGTQSVQVSWPVVVGASGYECVAKIVNDPDNPVEVYNGTVDGVTFAFPRERDKNYEVSVRTIGNAKFNNKDAVSAVVATLSTYVQPIQIESGDMGSTIKSIMDKYNDPEYIFVLSAGGSYQLDSELDFGESMVTIKGDESQHPIVTLGGAGVLRTSGGLTIENTNFDCTKNEMKGGIIECSSNPSDNLKGTATYLLSSPIILQGCLFKNVSACLVCPGNCSWGIEDVRVIDCIVQLNNDGSVWKDCAVISGYSTNHVFNGANSWYSAIKNTTIKNTTIYNIQNNSRDVRMIRFSNRDLNKVFGANDGSITMENCTFSKTFVSKEFANNMGNTAQFEVNISNCNFYAVFRLQKIKNGSTTINARPATNAICGGGLLTVDGTDKTTYATEEEFGFVGDCDQVLDLTKPDGGVNFKATGALSSTVGDPRWLN